MPLVADIHFQPVVANMVAECFEKIRVNPGNFVDGRKRFDEKVYDDDSQFKQEQEHIREVCLLSWGAYQRGVLIFIGGISEGCSVYRGGTVQNNRLLLKQQPTDQYSTLHPSGTSKNVVTVAALCDADVWSWQGVAPILCY